MSSVYRFCSVHRLYSGSVRLWGLWTRGFLASSVVKRCRRECRVREVFQCFRQTFRPRRTLLISATAAYKRDDAQDEPDECSRSISDEELTALLCEIDKIDELARNTLYCTGCGKRFVIEKKLPGTTYCSCKDSKPQQSEDGWEPYMEADDVIIWRKKYKNGQGLYAYKVYGRYKEVDASDFAAIQTDAGYRRRWDAAVASLAVVEEGTQGVADQAVLHWEVLWPRLFANRDYVYIRRHKEYGAVSKRAGSTIQLQARAQPEADTQRPSVHSRAKRKATTESVVTRDTSDKMVDSKVYIIMGRSCTHPDVPERNHVIRVTEYWSHMVIRTLDSPDESGMEFVLTYYDEPAVGGLPTGVASWATGRAAPAYLQRMRSAANNYHQYLEEQRKQGLSVPPESAGGGGVLSLVNAESDATVDEQDMESSKQGPDMDSNSENGQEKSQPPTEPKMSSKQTQTEDRDTRDPSKNIDPCKVDDASRNNAKGDEANRNSKDPSGNNDSDAKKNVPSGDNDKPSKQNNDSCEKNNLPSGKNDKIKTSKDLIQDTPAESEDGDKLEDNPEHNKGSWWRYLYPFYYFM